MVFYFVASYVVFVFMSFDKTHMVYRLIATNPWLEVFTKNSKTEITNWLLNLKSLAEDESLLKVNIST